MPVRQLLLSTVKGLTRTTQQQHGSERAVSQKAAGRYQQGESCLLFLFRTVKSTDKMIQGVTPGPRVCDFNDPVHPGQAEVRACCREEATWLNGFLGHAGSLERRCKAAGVLMAEGQE